jgi:hypothetical protein
MYRLAAVLTVSFVVVACSSFPDQVPASEGETKDQNGTTPSGGAQLPPSTPKSGTSPSNSSTPSETSAPLDAGATDATVEASTKDASPPTPKLAFGSACTDHAQCAGGICIPFEGKGLRCTKVCKSDSECPSNDCKDDPEVCDVD